MTVLANSDTLFNICSFPPSLCV